MWTGLGRRAGGGSPVLRSENFSDQGVSLPPFLTLGAQDTWATSLVDQEKTSLYALPSHRWIRSIYAMAVGEGPGQLEWVVEPLNTL